MRANLPARSLGELRGLVWAYNDRQSLSGWFRMLERLEALGAVREPESFFSRVFETSGSHVASIDLVARGEADVSAVDSNTSRLAR